ncbi:MAG: S9 family peptidase [Acidobacteriota bacterium]
MTNKYLVSIFIILYLFILNPGNFVNGENSASKLTLEKIFSKKEYEPESFGPFMWDKKGHSMTLLKPAENNDEIMELFRYYPAGNKFKKLISIDDLPKTGKKGEKIVIEDYSISPDGKKVLIFTKSEYVWRTKTRGNYWIYDLKSKKLIRAGKGLKESTMMFAKFSPDSRKIGYVSERNIYVENLSGEERHKLTDSGSDSIINGTFDWVYEEEFHMKDGFRWSPDGEHIAFWQFDISGVKDFHLIDYISDLYSKVIPIQYPKAGETNSSCRIGYVKSSGGTIKWIKFKGDPRMHYLARMDWADSPDEIIIQRLNRPQNRNNVWICNIHSGAMNNILTDTDETWLDVVDKFHWVNNGEFFLWISEKDGWRHIYRVSRDGKNFQLITKGNFDILSLLGIDRKKGIVYFSASPFDPTRSYLYSADIYGKEAIKRITPSDLPGTHDYDISEDSLRAVHYYSSFDSPKNIEIIRLPDHKQELMLEDNKKLKKKIKSLSLPPGEFCTLDIGNKVILNSWIMKPPDFDKNKKYPVIFYVYGEPWGQTVRDSWKGNTYLWHRLLTLKGYILMSIDNRGTPMPRGREFRKIVYKKLGVLPSEDQAAGVKAALKKFPFLDRDRIGVWGWSGGGSMTLNMLFRYPEIYKTGISVAPVADMRYYDSVYQERYMGHPEENKDAYIAGSPITFAKNLRGNLLLIHGTGDDNVHYQNSEALIDKLIEHNKQFSMMAYPNRRHSIKEGENTKIHLYTLMTRFILNNL